MGHRGRRSKAIFVRVSEREHEIIEAAAKRAGLSLAAFLRTEGMRSAQKMTSAAKSLTT